MLETLDERGWIRFGRHQNVLVYDWIGVAELEVVDLIRRFAGRITHEHPEGFVVVQFVRPTSPPPSPEIKAHLQKLTNAPGSPLKGLCTLAEGTELKKTLARSVMANFALSTAADIEILTTYDLDEAVAFICRLAPGQEGREAEWAAAIRSW